MPAAGKRKARLAITWNQPTRIIVRMQKSMEPFAYLTERSAQSWSCNQRQHHMWIHTAPYEKGNLIVIVKGAIKISSPNGDIIPRPQSIDGCETCQGEVLHKCNPRYLGPRQGVTKPWKKLAPGKIRKVAKQKKNLRSNFLKKLWKYLCKHHIKSYAIAKISTHVHPEIYEEN